MRYEFFANVFNVLAMIVNVRRTSDRCTMATQRGSDFTGSRSVMRVVVVRTSAACSRPRRTKRLSPAVGGRMRHLPIAILSGLILFVAGGGAPPPTQPPPPARNAPP